MTRLNTVTRYTGGLVVVLLLTLCASCAHNPWKQTLVHSSTGVAVYKETKHSREGRQIAFGYSHPIKIPAEEMVALLSTLKYEHKPILRSSRIDPVFTQTELERLAAPVSEALASLKPDERLRFLSISKEGLLFTRRDVGNSAVLFADAPTQLNIVFSQMNGSLPSIDLGDPESVNIDVDPTTIEDFEDRLVTPKNVRLKLRNWIVVDPADGSQWIAGAEAMATKAKEAKEAATHVSTSTTSSQRVYKMPKSGAKTRSAAPAPAAPKAETASTPPVVAAKPASVRAAAEEKGTAEFKLKYKGFSIFKYEGEIYAVDSAKKTFDINKDYDVMIRGESEEEVIDTINALADSFKKK